MHNIRFINHALLFCYDKTIIKNEEYREYFSLYERFPTPPGIEYILPRNVEHSALGIQGPWNFDLTSFPIPELANISFSDAADSFGEHVSKQINAGKQVYILWSGGIDSTCVLVSVLRNTTPAQHTNIHIVLNENSILENTVLYNKFLKDFDQIAFSKFDPGTLDIENSLILDGEGGDQLFGSSAANKVFSKYPEKIQLPWRDNVDFLRQQWQDPQNDKFWDMFYNIMTFTINKGTAPVETLYDFYWWLNFNFKIDASMYRSAMYLSATVPDDKFEYFFKNTICRFYTWPQIQQWSMTAGAYDKIGHARKMVKHAGRRYIYEFDKNEFYYREKRKEFSLRLTTDALAPFIAVDSSYNRYHIGSRQFRKELRNTFYPDVTGRINFYQHHSDIDFMMSADIKSK